MKYIATDIVIREMIKMNNGNGLYDCASYDSIKVSPIHYIKRKYNIVAGHTLIGTRHGNDIDTRKTFLRKSDGLALLNDFKLLISRT